MHKPRVLIVENAVDFTGGLSSIMRSCTELRDSFDFRFVLPKESQSVVYIQNLGFEVHLLPMKEIRRDSMAILSYLPVLVVNSIRLRRLIKQLNIEIILCNDFYNLVPSVYKMLGGRVPYICYVRFRPSKFPSILVKFWCWFHYKYAAYVVAVSNTVKNELPPQHNVRVIGNEVPTHHVTFTPTTSRTILYPANYIRGKGQEFALRTFAAVIQKHPQWRLKFVGSDMGLNKNRFFKKELMEEAGRLGITHAVEWGSFEKDMARQYAEAAIVLNFSESESFSLTCLEAMFYGRPIVATKCGGPEEIIDDGLSGILVGLANVEEMAAAVDSLITQPHKREEIGKAAFTIIRGRYSYENTVGKLKELYNSTLSGQSFNTR
jgi:L-malate glycosyltransferase